MSTYKLRFESIEDAEAWKAQIERSLDFIRNVEGQVSKSVKFGTKRSGTRETWGQVFDGFLSNCQGASLVKGQAKSMKGVVSEIVC